MLLEDEHTKKKIRKNIQRNTACAILNKQVQIFYHFMGAYIAELLTVTDDSTQRISFEVKLDIHVLPLWIGAQQLELNINHVNIHCDRDQKPSSVYSGDLSKKPLKSQCSTTYKP